MTTTAPADESRILFLTPQLPYPLEQGTAIRNFNLIAQVARRHKVALLSFAEGARTDFGPLREICDPIVTIPAPERSMVARLRTLLTSSDPDMAHRLASTAYAQALRALLFEQSFDVLQIEGIEMASFAFMARQWRGVHAPAIVFDDHNAEYVLQRRALETDRRHPRRWPAAVYSLMQWRRLAEYERRVCRAADAVLAVSQADALALAALAPDIRPVVVPNGVDTEYYRPNLPDILPLQHPAVVFTGKMDFRPNVDAMLWFYRHVWPRIVAEVPEAHGYIVGKNPDPRLAALSDDPSVTVTGHVPDISPYFGGADVYVVPLRIGGGTRLKVLEAMAAGLPIVTTSLGAEGIDLTPNVHARVADRPAEYAAAVVTLLRDAVHAQALGAAARQFAVERYAWRRIIPRLEDVYSAL